MYYTHGRNKDLEELDITGKSVFNNYWYEIEDDPSLLTACAYIDNFEDCGSFINYNIKFLTFGNVNMHNLDRWSKYYKISDESIQKIKQVLKTYNLDNFEYKGEQNILVSIDTYKLEEAIKEGNIIYLDHNIVTNVHPCLYISSLSFVTLDDTYILPYHISKEFDEKIGFEIKDEIDLEDCYIDLTMDGIVSFVF